MEQAGHPRWSGLGGTQEVAELFEKNVRIQQKESAGLEHLQLKQVFKMN